MQLWALLYFLSANGISGVFKHFSTAFSLHLSHTKLSLTFPCTEIWVRTTSHKSDKIGNLELLCQMAVSKATHVCHSSETLDSSAWLRDTDKRFSSRFIFIIMQTRGEVSRQVEVGNRQAKTSGKKEASKRQSPKTCRRSKNRQDLFCLFCFFRLFF